MRVIARRVAVAIAAATMVVTASHASAQTASAARGNAASGKAVYLKAGCHACHGTMGQGAPGPRLAPKPIAQAAFIGFVRSGKLNNPRANRNWSGMPPYSAKFISNTDLDDIYAYLASIPEPPASIPLLR